MQKANLNYPLSGFAQKAIKFVVKAQIACAFTFLTLFTACDKDRNAENNPACVEKPKADCVHTEEYMPVCGCNNVTYSNAGVAKCAGIEDFKPGKCPK